jgi:hypothetical protein
MPYFEVGLGSELVCFNTSFLHACAYVARKSCAHAYEKFLFVSCRLFYSSSQGNKVARSVMFRTCSFSRVRLESLPPRNYLTFVLPKCSISSHRLRNSTLPRTLQWQRVSTTSSGDQQKIFPRVKATGA